MVTIPPRKRARLLYEEEDEDEADEEEDENEGAEFSEDEEDEDDDEDEAEFTDDGSEEESDDSDSGGGMLNGRALLEGGDAEHDDDEEEQANTKDPARSGLLPTLDCVAALQMAFPSHSRAVISKRFRKTSNDIRQAFDDLARDRPPTLSFDEMMDKAVTGILESLTNVAGADLDQSDQNQSRPLIQEVEDIEMAPGSVESSRLVDFAMSSDSDTSSSGSSSDESEDEEDDSEDDESSFEGVDDGKLDGSESESESDFEMSDDSSSSDDSSDVSEEPIQRAEVPSVKQTSSAATESTVAPGMGMTKTKKRNARRKLARQMKNAAAANGDIEEQLAARKAALLATVADDEEPSAPTAQEVVAADNKAAADDTSAASTPRRRMDMGAGRRLLFGALGLKNPKSQAEEAAIRDTLMKDVKPVKNARLIQEVEVEEPAADEEDSSWRDKITYRAVECCHEGVELSEPPFPFVQRWDPQQQYQPSRKRKRKSQQNYDEEEASYYDDATDGQDAAQTNGVDELNYDEQPNGQPNGHVEEAEADLPVLPEDLSSLETLAQGAAKANMVITWKQLVMSKATNWQPQIKDFTGRVVADETADGIDLVLAKRDRDTDGRQYDQETGERVYDRFEVPDMEDGDGDDEPEDDGARKLAWLDMTEARILSAGLPVANGVGA